MEDNAAYTKSAMTIVRLAVLGKKVAKVRVRLIDLVATGAGRVHICHVPVKGSFILEEFGAYVTTLMPLFGVMSLLIKHVDVAQTADLMGRIHVA